MRNSTGPLHEDVSPSARHNNACSRDSPWCIQLRDSRSLRSIQFWSWRPSASPHTSIPILEKDRLHNLLSDWLVRREEEVVYLRTATVSHWHWLGYVAEASYRPQPIAIRANHCFVGRLLSKSEKIARPRVGHVTP